MSTLKKAVTQEHITADTVDLQFCSDWLKDEIKRLFVTNEALQYKLSITEGQRDNESGVLELVAEERDRYRATLVQVKLAMEDIAEECDYDRIDTILEGITKDIDSALE